MHKKNRLRTRWEWLDGRRVRLRLALPAAARWADPATRPPLLLLHGLGNSVEAWEPAQRRLEARGLDRPVYALDLPGSGRSGGPREALGVAELADWVTRVMDLLGIARAHVAGNSLGSQVGLALARRHPARVGGLVLAGPTGGGDHLPLWRSALGLLLDGLAEPMLYNGALPRMYLQTGVPRYLATVRKMQEDDPLASAAQVKAPVLLVRGGLDAVVPEMAARRLAAALPNGAFTEVEGSPHAVPSSAPETFTRIALAFWERIERSEAGPAGAAPEAAASDDAPLREADNSLVPPMPPLRGGGRGAARRKTDAITVDGRAVHCRLVPPARAAAPGTTAGLLPAGPVPALPILLLHGLAGSGAAWGRAFPLLEACRLSAPVFAPDLPGFGCSPGPPGALGMEELGDWAARFLDAAGVARAHVAGNSMGCQVALALARRHRGRIGGLVLAGPTVGGPGGVPLWRYVVGMAFNSGNEPWLYKALAAWMFLQTGPRRYAATVRRMMADDVLAGAAAVAAPALVVRGARDGLIPEASARRLAAVLPRGAFAAIPGAAHVLQYNSPRELTHLALSFWAEAEQDEEEEEALRRGAVAAPSESNGFGILPQG